MPVEAGARAYDRGEIDGFFSLPAAAVAFQWSAQVRFLLDLRVDYFSGCVVVAERVFAKLSPAEQTALREAGAQLRERFEEVGRRTDDQLLGGLFQRQGLSLVRVDETFRAEFFAAAEAARAQIAEKFVSKELLARVAKMLAEVR
jgi:TRAP-type C4-dicarboxylate transport system substrate-binding protein